MLFAVASLGAGCGALPGTVGDSGDSKADRPSVPAPVAKKVPHPVTLNGDTRQDDYFWIRDQAAFGAWTKDQSKGFVLQDADVAAYIDAENNYTETMSARFQPLQDQLVKEMKSYQGASDDSTVPVRIGAHQYYDRKDAGQTYKVWYRRAVDASGAASGPEEALLDPNVLAKGLSYYDLRAHFVSPNEQRIAYAVDTAGARICTLSIKDLATGQTTEINQKVTTWGETATGWSADSNYLFYTTVNESARANKIWRHKVGDAPSADQLVYEETNDAVDTYIRPTRSGKYLVIGDRRVIPADQPLAQPIVITTDKDHQYQIDHSGEYFYIRTDLGAEDGALMRTKVTAPTPENWEAVIPGQPGRLIEDIQAYDGHLVVLERENGLQKIEVLDLASNATTEVAFDEQVYSLDTVFDDPKSQNPSFDLGTFRFAYKSFLAPDSVREYSFASGEQKVLRQNDVPGYDPSRYESKRLFATADDGSMVPISLVYRKGIKLDGSNPMVLYAYGSYGFSKNAYFSEWNGVTTRLSLLDRGVVYGIAHIRGGGEMGAHWYKQGVFMNKKNSFTDFASCVRTLIAEGYTSSDRLGIHGASAGGLVMGYMLNNEPGLFRAALLDAPFVDLLNDMSDPTLPLTTEEYDQWGNPSIPEQYSYMKSYSPYDNVTPHDDPAVLMKTGVNDTSVFYWEPTKLTARLRANKTNDSLLMLRVSGHGHITAATDTDGAIKDYALNYGFLLDQIGASELK
jgi:oligopeptidase B